MSQASERAPTCPPPLAGDRCSACRPDQVARHLADGAHHPHLLVVPGLPDGRLPHQGDGQERSVKYCRGLDMGMEETPRRGCVIY